MFEFDEEPEELQSPPEKRMIGTFLTGRPSRQSLWQTAMYVLFISVFTQFYWIDPINLSHLLPAVGAEIFDKFELWRLVTAMFIHGDIAHLLSNLYMLSIFSYFVLAYYGTTTFWSLTLIGGSLVNLLAIMTYPPHVRLLGASGLVYLFGGFWLILYMFIQKQHSFTKRIVRVIGMGLMVFFPTSFEPTTSYRTHFIGFAVGLTIGLIYYILNRKKVREKDQYVYV